MKQTFLCMNKSCCCGQDEILHHEIYNTPFELTDNQLLILTRKHPYQYIKTTPKCEYYEDEPERCGDCDCWDNKNVIRRATPGEYTPKRIAEMEKFKKEWFERKDLYYGK